MIIKRSIKLLIVFVAFCISVAFSCKKDTAGSKESSMIGYWEGNYKKYPTFRIGVLFRTDSSARLYLIGGNPDTTVTSGKIEGNFSINDKQVDSDFPYSPYQATIEGITNPEFTVLKAKIITLQSGTIIDQDSIFLNKQ